MWFNNGMRYSTPIDVLFEPGSLSSYYERVARTVYNAQRSHQVFDAPPCAPVDVDVDRWTEIEADVHHETAAWVQAWREVVPASVVPYTYLGMTSSNLQDCAFALMANDLVEKFTNMVANIKVELNHLALNNETKLRAGRTHGQFAHPVCMSEIYHRTAVELDVSAYRLSKSRPLGALGGPTGNPLSDVLTDEVLSNVSFSLDIYLDPHPTQVASRLQLNRFAQEVYNLGAVVEQLAVFHRLESLSGIERFQEGFDASRHKGSSSMPHKINPRRSERICGLARVNRGNLQAVTETCSTLWWERDLSNSSVERVALRDLICTTAFMMQETWEILRTSTVSEGVEIMPDYVWDHKRLVGAQLRGEDPEQAYRELQARRLGGSRA